MKLYKIEEGMSVNKGEYLFHVPTQQIVMCGKFNPDEGYIQALGAGRLLQDKISHFNKIHLTKQEHRDRRTAGCAGCKGRSSLT